VKRDAKQNDDGRLPGLTLQRETLTFAMQAQLIGTLTIDPATNCLVLRISVSNLVDGMIVTGDELVDVAWPLGWSVALRDGKPALLDMAGQAVGHPGDEVSVGGGSVATAKANVTSCTGQPHVFVASGLTRASASSRWRCSRRSEAEQASRALPQADLHPA
jgi:hypothetical protein